MATQKDALYELLVDTSEWLAQLEVPSRRHEKAKQKLLKMLDNRSIKLLNQIKAYNSKRVKQQNVG